MAAADAYLKAQNLAAEKQILAARIYGDMNSLFEISSMAEVDKAVHAARQAIVASARGRASEQGLVG